VYNGKRNFFIKLCGIPVKLQKQNGGHSINNNYMKHLGKISLLFFLCLFTFYLSAQTDRTSLITNPSFETGTYDGWIWTGRTGGWIDVNSDGDATKNGDKIAGYYNSPIADVECSQTLTGLPSGYYKVTALATVSNGRTTNQRLFANSKSILFGSQSNLAYSDANMAILNATESVSFAGYTESTAENGPFKKLSVCTLVTDGSLKIGFKVSGKATALGFDYGNMAKGDAGFFKFDNFTLTEVSNDATLGQLTLNKGTLDGFFDPAVMDYTASLPKGTLTITPTVLPGVDGQTITGTNAVDVSTGSGTSTIKVTSYDGTASKTYTIRYTVLTVDAYSILTDGVLFNTPGKRMMVSVCNPRIIRVSYFNSATLPQKDSIVVNKVWGTPVFNVTETDASVKISTSSLDVYVSKSTYLVSYFNKNGTKILSENDKGLSPTTLTTTHTTTNTLACSAVFDSPANEGLYGLGQHQGSIMNHKGRTQSIDEQNGEVGLPFLVSSLGYGILWDNYSYTFFDGSFSSNTKYQFRSESGKMVDYYFMYGPEMDTIISSYRIASGKAPLFPKWAYGLFQSKDKYTSSAELLGIGNQYRKAGIPVDCIVQDWDYWSPDYWGSNKMDANRYPDPKALIDSLHSLNLHSMISIWPVFHSSTANYKAFEDIGALYYNLGGSHRFYDPHNDAAKKIYWNQLNNDIFGKYGWDAWWADNDEPQGYPDGFDRKDFITGKGPGVTYYNTFAIEHTSGVYAGWRASIANKRVFTLSRSAFSGQQRYAAAVWSGDISSDWGSFQRQMSAGLNFSLSGMPYWTTDIGGYFGTDWTLPDNQELMTRWFEYGTFCPLYRIHGKGDKALISSQSFTQNTIDHMVKFDKLRYRLMPYIYSMAWKVTNDNYTMMRHLIMDYRTDVNVKSIDNQFMFGPALMVNPVTSSGVSKRSVYLPAGIWFDFWTGKQWNGSQTLNTDAPLDKIPLFVKAGSVMPMGPDISYANQSVDPIEIRVYKGANGNFTLYEDEGDNYNYEKNQYSEIPFTYEEATKKLIIGARTGSFKNMLTERTFKIVFVTDNYGVGLNDPAVYDSVVHYIGNEVIVSFNANRVLPVLHYEAESATISGTAAVASVQTGFTGTGYVNGLEKSNNSKVTFNVSAPKAGFYKLNLRYSAGSASDRRNLTVTVNNNLPAELKCEKTQDWNTWGEAYKLAYLNSGDNVIQFGADTAYVALDYLDIMLPTSNPAFMEKERICLIKQMDQSKYITASGEAIMVSQRDTTDRNQLWKIEQIKSGVFKITSEVTGQCMTIRTAAQPEGAKILGAVYSDQINQQWNINDFGTNVFQFSSEYSNLSMTTSLTDTLVQNSNTYLPTQLWMFEDTIAEIVTSVYEPFNYVEGSLLNGQGRVGSGWGSAWTVFDGKASDFSVQAPSAFNGLLTSGNRLTAGATASAGLRIYRDLNPRWEDDGKNIWLSFLLEIKNPTSLSTTWQGLSLFNGSNERVLIGKNWGQSKLGLNGSDAAQTLSNVSAFNLPQTWVVMKIVTSGNSSNENAYLWFNPNPKTEPQVSTANVTSTIQINSGFDRIVCHMGNTSGVSASFDEIRIGKDFSQVSNPITGLTHPKANQSDLIVVTDQLNKTSRISYHSQISDRGMISVYDLSGSKCYEQQVNVNAANNDYVIPMDKASFHSGVYLVSLQTSTVVLYGKICLK
jgi:alpha-D-xyloside xylohydrolase